MGDVVDQLRDAGLGRGDLVGLAVAGDRATMAVADRDAHLVIALGDVRQVEEELRPRWATWSQDTRLLVEAGLRVAAAWDVAAVHRLLFGEWRAEPARAWARLQDLPLDTLPTTQPFDLFSHADWTAQDPDDPLGPDGHLNPGWLDAAGPRHPPGCRPGPRWPGRPRTASRSR